MAALVDGADSGDASAKDALFASLYSELRRLAHSHLRQRQLLMGTTTLLHEAYLDLSSRSTLAVPDRLRFLKYASRAMRHLVIDYVRTKRARKRGGEITLIDGLQAGMDAQRTWRRSPYSAMRSTNWLEWTRDLPSPSIGSSSAASRSTRLP